MGLEGDKEVLVKGKFLIVMEWVLNIEWEEWGIKKRNF